MVYSYKRKTNQGSWSEDDMRRAMEEVKSKGLSLKSASKRYNVPIFDAIPAYEEGICAKKN
ncbi:hypothetical protein L9F63_028061 [Diploptera punctata]|uniref:HTH psq-type domain-containing protein n=1 Tax=Diploptera punctata TaxID=6984 RepID=A0AAD7ZYW9_DIPPU|nr:hypothetical protein L9F63_028061 [Diploptera punctata]